MAKDAETSKPKHLDPTSEYYLSSQANSDPSFFTTQSLRDNKRKREMAGIMNKIGETLHIGGHKEGDKQGEHKPGHKEGHGGYSGEHKEGHKEGLMEKIHEIEGGGGEHHGDKGEKKKKDKKKHGEGHDGGQSSDSDIN
ncbi:hypothetical protein RJ639_023938 [Escallonia herrerae]|uniref:Uncharacterized protein n=1 Tax=Escallonia herrerae TaxID=1293975 RepID=A0AA89AEX5_9ASTE|nr:hypothetical protein RJ639_023938 [Escallonia herrerae]